MSYYWNGYNFILTDSVTLYSKFEDLFQYFTHVKLRCWSCDSSQFILLFFGNKITIHQCHKWVTWKLLGLPLLFTPEFCCYKQLVYVLQPSLPLFLDSSHWSSHLCLSLSSFLLLLLQMLFFWNFNTIRMLSNSSQSSVQNQSPISAAHQPFKIFPVLLPQSPGHLFILLLQNPDALNCIFPNVHPPPWPHGLPVCSQ